MAFPPSAGAAEIVVAGAAGRAGLRASPGPSRHRRDAAAAGDAGLHFLTLRAANPADHPLAGTFHNGIDLPAPAGAPVRAVASGRVIRAQRRGPGGLELLVQHHGFVGIYSHLGSIAPAIADGHLQVRAGQKLGVVGHTGVTYGMHLFFAMERDGKFVDPAPYLDIALCRVGLRRRSDMLARNGKIPPTRHFAAPVRRLLYARK